VLVVALVVEVVGQWEPQQQPRPPALHNLGESLTRTHEPSEVGAALGGEFSKEMERCKIITVETAYKVTAYKVTAYKVTAYKVNPVLKLINKNKKGRL